LRSTQKGGGVDLTGNVAGGAVQVDRLGEPDGGRGKISGHDGEDA
jgi:hypothetical protein